MSGTWLSASLFGALFIGSHYLLLRAASGRLGDTLGALVLESTAALGLLVAYVLSPREALIPTRPLGVAFAMASGLCISAASILIFAAMRRGGPVATTGTIVLGGGVALSALLAPLFFAEEGFTVRRVVGVALGLAAMAVLSQDGR